MGRMNTPPPCLIRLHDVAATMSPMSLPEITIIGRDVHDQPGHLLARHGVERKGQHRPVRKEPREAVALERVVDDGDHGKQNRQSFVQRRDDEIVVPGLVSSVHVVLRQPVAKRLPEPAAQTQHVGEEGGEQQQPDAVEHDRTAKPEPAVPGDADHGGEPQDEHQHDECHHDPLGDVHVLNREQGVSGGSADRGVGACQHDPRANQPVLKYAHRGRHVGRRQSRQQHQVRSPPREVRQAHRLGVGPVAIAHAGDVAILAARFRIREPGWCSLSEQPGNPVRRRHDEQVAANDGDENERGLLGGKGQREHRGAQVEVSGFALVMVAPEQHHKGQRPHGHEDVVAGVAAVEQHHWGERQHEGGGERPRSAQAFPQEERKQHERRAEERVRQAGHVVVVAQQEVEGRHSVVLERAVR